MRQAIVVPDYVWPKKDPENPCPCQERELRLTYKSCLLFWQAEVGEWVEAGQVVCEGEVEKMAFQLNAPCAGRLAERCFEQEASFTAGAVLGYIETED